MTPHACPLARAAGFDSADLLVALPYLVGYDPGNSLVCVLLRADDSIAVTMRLDWPAAVSDPARTAREAAARAAVNGAAEAVVVAVRPHPPQWRRTMALLVRQLTGHGIAVAWSGFMDAVGWREARCDPAGCLPHPLPQPESSDLVLNLIVAGAAPAATRAEVTAELSPGPDRQRLVQVGASRADLEAWRDDAVDRLHRLLGAGVPLDDEAVELLAAGMADIRVRDTWLHRITNAVPPGGSGQWPAVWRLTTTAMRRAPVAYVAPLAAVAALAAWQLGDGLRAGEALVRAKEADPEHSLARLLQGALDGGAPPSVWHEVMSSLSEADCRYGKDHDSAA